MGVPIGKGELFRQATHIVVLVGRSFLVNMARIVQIGVRMKSAGAV